MNKTEYIIAEAQSIRSALGEPAVICSDASARELSQELMHDGLKQGRWIQSFTELGIRQGHVYRLSDKIIVSMFGSPHYLRVGTTSELRQEWRRLSGFAKVD